ncbi:hypothetical protein H0H93_012582 [Arthromyces matolae]|nr:hypothetical protein H0H93_012582 [Arthromyces matolae]
MPASKYDKRGNQLSTSSLGVNFTSPLKRQDKVKTTTYVRPIGKDQEIAALRAKLDALKRRAAGLAPLYPIVEAAPIPELVQPTTVSEEIVDTQDDVLPGSDTMAMASESPRAPRCTQPNRSAHDRYSNWTTLLPRLVAPLLEYNSKTIGAIPDRVTGFKANCKTSGKCMIRTNEVLCLFHEYFQKFSIDWCNCQDLPQILIANGLFPTAPLFPRIAISIHLLDFYRALFERSCDAINAMAQALNTLYARRGFIITDKKGNPIRDAFWRGLGYAVQWYDNLQLRLEQRLEAAIVEAHAAINASSPPAEDLRSSPSPSLSPQVNLTTSSSMDVLTQGIDASPTPP